MNEVNPWRLPTKTKGRVLKPSSYKFEPALTEAAKRLAATESVLMGTRITTTVFLSNVLTRKEEYFRIRHNQLKDLHQKLRQEGLK